MRILIHVGLNKCASTSIQRALAGAADRLAKVGVCYPWQADRPAHYGLSRHYGFGPMAEDIAPVSLGDMVAEARVAGADRLILSSEYLSLYAPRAVRALTDDAAAAGADVEIVLIRRDVEPWVRSLFNQYVKTVEGGRPMANLDAFVAHVLGNGAVNVARRVDQWQQVLGCDRVSLYDLPERAAPCAVLRPFANFAGVDIAPPPEGRNESLDADRLFAVGRLRQEHASKARDRAIAALFDGAPADTPAPDGYLDLGATARARLVQEIAEPMRVFDWRPLDAIPTAVAA